MRRHLFRWFTSWAEIADGIVGVLSLGFVHTGWSYKICMDATLYEARKLRDQNGAG